VILQIQKWVSPEKRPVVVRPTVKVSRAAQFWANLSTAYWQKTEIWSASMRSGRSGVGPAYLDQLLKFAQSFVIWDAPFLDMME
jgi:hypothetical protein